MEKGNGHINDMYCHHCNQERCIYQAGTYSGSTMTTPNTKPQVSEEDKRIAEQVISFYLVNDNLDGLVEIMAAYRIRSLQTHRDALRVAEKALKVARHDTMPLSNMTPLLIKEALASIQPLLKED